MCIFNELMHDWWYECVCMCMSVLCLRDGFMFCVTFPAWAFSYIFVIPIVYIKNDENDNLELFEVFYISYIFWCVPLLKSNIFWSPFTMLITQPHVQCSLSWTSFPPVFQPRHKRNVFLIPYRQRVLLVHMGSGTSIHFATHYDLKTPRLVLI